MKTINADLGVFLKRTNSKVICWYDDKAAKFCVTVDGYLSHSGYLDGAMENAAEETRRRANAMQPMRDAKPEPATNKPSVTLPVTGGSTASVCAKCKGMGYTVGKSGGISYMAYCSCVMPSPMTFTVNIP